MIWEVFPPLLFFERVYGELIFILWKLFRSWFFLLIAVQPISRVWLFVTPQTAACQASLSFTIFQSLLKFLCIESVKPSKHFLSSLVVFSFCLQSFPASGSFPTSQLFPSGGQSISFSFSVSPPNEYSGLVSFGSTSSISLKSKGLSWVFSRSTIRKHQFFSAQPLLCSNSHPCMASGETISLTIWTFVGKVVCHF